MIRKLTPITGTWNDDTAKIIAKINEIVDALNDMDSKRAKVKTKGSKNRTAKDKDKDKAEGGIDVDAFAVGEEKG